jgi:hypothetical protein
MKNQWAHAFFPYPPFWYKIWAGRLILNLGCNNLQSPQFGHLSSKTYMLSTPYLIWIGLDMAAKSTKACEMNGVPRILSYRPTITSSNSHL